MTALCAFETFEATQRIDVKHPLRLAALDASIGRIPSLQASPGKARFPSLCKWLGLPPPPTASPPQRATGSRPNPIARRAAEKHAYRRLDDDRADAVAEKALQHGDEAGPLVDVVGAGYRRVIELLRGSRFI